MSLDSGGFNWDVGQGLALGIADAGRSIGGGLAIGNDRREREKEKQKKEAQEAAALRKLMATTDPDHKDSYTTMGLPELQGAHEAIAVKGFMERQKREQQDQEYQQQQRAAYPKFMAALNPQAPGGVGPDAPLTPGRFLQAAQSSGYDMPPQEMMQLMKEDQGVDWNRVMPREMTTSSGRNLVYGKGGQFQFEPDATPDSLTAIPVLDADGNVIGQRVPTARGGTAPVAAAKTTRPVPDSYDTRLADALKRVELNQSNLALSDAELAKRYPTLKPAAKRTALKAEQAVTVRGVKNLLDSYRQRGYGDEEFWSAEYARHGLTPPRPETGTPAPPRGGGTSAGAGGALVSVTNPQGKRVQIRSDQLEAALAQGYTQ